MLTRRQKNSIRGVTAALTCSAMLAGVLIYVNISNATQVDLVKFSEILEGAVAYSDDNDESPAVTLASDELMETMFGDEPDDYHRESFPELIVSTTPASVTYIPPGSENTAATPDITESDDTTYSEETVQLIPLDPNDITAISTDLDLFTTQITTSTTEPPGTSETTTTSASGNADIEITTQAPVTFPTYVSSSGTVPVTTTSATTTSATTTTTVTTTVTTTTTRATTTKPETTAKTTAPRETTTSKTVFTNVGGGTFSNDDEIYLTMFKLVNKARKEAGLKELWYSARVHDVCRIRTQELTSYYSHNRPDGTKFSTAFKEIGIAYKKCGENIAYGRNMFKTPEEVFKAWMDSETHRENILAKDYDCCAFGLSVLTVGKDTYYYWSQEFAKF